MLGWDVLGHMHGMEYGGVDRMGALNNSALKHTVRKVHAKFSSGIKLSVSEFVFTAVCGMN